MDVRDVDLIYEVADIIQRKAGLFNRAENNDEREWDDCVEAAKDVLKLLQDKEERK